MTASKASEPTPMVDTAIEGWSDLVVGQSRLVPASAFAALLELARNLERDPQKAEARAAEAERKAGELWNKCMLCAKANKEFVARAEAAELDAGRYRWLRMQGGKHGRVSVIQWEPGNKERDGSTIRSEELDSYVDAALRRSAP